MKVLLDHNIPHALRSHFPDHCEVHTAHHLGWATYEDDTLLTAAVDESYSVFVTLDTSLKEQQALHEWEIGVIVLDVHPTTAGHLERRMDEVVAFLSDVAASHTVASVT